MQLTPKENSLLKDMKDEEKLCMEKYSKYAAQAHDKQLTDLFNQISNVEQNHYNTLSQIESGNPPAPPSGNAWQSSSEPTFTATYKAEETQEKKDDCYLCTDLLATEKRASSLYDTCIFEFQSQQVRDVLNHIQKEEQNHGKYIYDYMATNSMYG